MGVERPINWQEAGRWRSSTQWSQHDDQSWRRAGSWLKPWNLRGHNPQSYRTYGRYPQDINKQQLLDVCMWCNKIELRFKCL